MDNNIIDLLIYLKEQVAIDIIHKYDPNEKFMTERVPNGKTYTRQEIADHIKDNTELGQAVMRGFLLMAIEFFDRKTRPFPDERLERYEDSKRNT